MNVHLIRIKHTWTGQINAGQNFRTRLQNYLECGTSFCHSGLLGSDAHKRQNCFLSAHERNPARFCGGDLHPRVGEMWNIGWRPSSNHCIQCMLIRTFNACLGVDRSVLNNGLKIEEIVSGNPASGSHLDLSFNERSQEGQSELLFRITNSLFYL